MIDKETKERIADYFSGPALVEFLNIPVMDLIEAFEDDIEEALDDINDEIGYP